MNIRQSKRRLVRLGAAAVAAAVALAATGCGQKLSGQPQPAETEQQLVYWSVWNANEPQSKIFKTALDDFGRQTGVKVELKVLGRNQGQTVQDAIAAGNGPDLFDTGSDGLAAARKNGQLADMTGVLDEEVPGEGKTVGEVLPKLVKEASSDDKGFGMVPHTLISTGLWFDATRHPELTASPPKTFDDFLTLLDKLKAAGRAPLAQDGTVNFYNIYWFYWLMMRHGGPGSLRALAGDAQAWDDPKVLAAATDVARLAKGNYFQPGWDGTKYPVAQTAWSQGKYDLNLNGTWLPAETKPVAAKTAKPRSFQFPTVPGGQQSVEVGTLGLSISAKAEHPKAAAKFLAFLLQKKYQTMISTEAFNLPARADVPAPDALIDVQKAIASASSVNATYDQAPAADQKWWEDVLLPLDDKLLGGKLSAAEFVSQGKTKTAAYLKNKGR